MTNVQFVGKLTPSNLNDPRADARTKTYWRAIRPQAIRKLVVRSLAVLIALGSIVAISLVGVLSFGCYGVAKLLGRVRPLRDTCQFLSQAYDRFIDRLGQRVLRDSRDTPALRIMVSHPYCCANFPDPARFRKTSTSAGDRFLSFAVRFQISALYEDVQRQTHGGAPAPWVLLRGIREGPRALCGILSRIFVWGPSRTGSDGSCPSPP
jgi:hypothetical protein